MSKTLETIGIRYLEVGSKVILRDGKPGYVVLGNQESSLIEFKADPRSGCDRERDWFNHSELRYPA